MANTDRYIFVYENLQYLYHKMESSVPATIAAICTRSELTKLWPERERDYAHNDQNHCISQVSDEFGWLTNLAKKNKLTTDQSQKTQGFCVADFATLSDETRSRSKIFPLFIWIKEPCVRKFEGLECSKLLGISQTMMS